MTSKEYLSQISKYNRMISNKLQEISQLKMIAYSITPQNTGEKVQSSYKTDKISGIAAEIADKEQELGEIFKERNKIVKQIDGIQDANAYDVLTKNFVLGKSIKVIAIENTMTEKQVGRIHKNAVQLFEKTYGYLYK